MFSRRENEKKERKRRNSGGNCFLKKYFVLFTVYSYRKELYYDENSHFFNNYKS